MSVSLTPEEIEKLKQDFSEIAKITAPLMPSSLSQEIEELKQGLAETRRLIAELTHEKSVESEKLVEPIETVEPTTKKRRTKKTPKELATERKEPWVDVIKTHVNMDNIRNGFFELDWNQYFIVQLKNAGYGADGDSDESIVDRWFRDLARNMLAEEGMDSSRGAGFVNVTKIDNNRSIIE